MVIFRFRDGSPWKAGCALLGLIWIAGNFGCSRSDEAPGLQVDHLILVVVDTLRADVVGCYGGDAETPVMDRLAAEGVRFTAARSHIPITGPSHASLFTSRLPTEHGVRNNTQILDLRYPVLAELMQGRGFATAAFVSLGVLKGKFGLDRGFATYVDHFGENWFRDAVDLNRDVFSFLGGAAADPTFLWVHYSDPHEPYAAPNRVFPEVRIHRRGEEGVIMPADGRRRTVPVRLENGRARLVFHSATEGFVEGALLTLVGGKLSSAGVIRAGHGMFPWFENQVENDFVTALPGVLDIELEDRSREEVEFRFQLGLKLSPEETKTAYLEEVEFVDHAIGELLRELETSGRLERAIVILTSDHGEGLGDHDHVGHIDQLYDSLLHVPLILWAPHLLPSGGVVDEAVGLVDLLPTVCAMTGIEVPSGIRGRNLLPLVAGGDAVEVGHFAQTFRPEATRDLESLISDRFKLIRGAGSSALELYNLRDDPEELIDLATLEPVRAASLANRLDRMLARSGNFSAEAAAIDEETRDRLRALGYEH